MTCAFCDPVLVFRQAAPSVDLHPPGAELWTCRVSGAAELYLDLK